MSTRLQKQAGDLRYQMPSTDSFRLKSTSNFLHYINWQIY